MAPITSQDVSLQAATTPPPSEDAIDPEVGSDEEDENADEMEIDETSDGEDD